MVERAFLDEIEANPHDDVPKLIYADWLDEQGDPLGAVIRLSCELRKKLLECGRPSETLNLLGISDSVLIDPGSRVRLKSVIAGVEFFGTVVALPFVEHATFEADFGSYGPVRKLLTGRKEVTLKLALHDIKSN